MTVNYAVQAHTSVVSESATLLTQYPDVLMATVAGFLLLGIGIVSMRAARRRVRYETWYYLHLYTYLAIALAFSHQFADGVSFVNSLAARFWWSAMYLTVVVLVLWYRVAVPLRAFVRHGFKVLGVKDEGPGVISVYIGGSRLDELAAEPGQFFRWRFLTPALWWSSHPYSLSAARAGARPAMSPGERSARRRAGCAGWTPPSRLTGTTATSAGSAAGR
jgi:predicted ferric reductase